MTSCTGGHASHQAQNFLFLSAGNWGQGMGIFELAGT